MNNGANLTTNSVPLLSSRTDNSPNSDVEELDPLTLGASEEVNTSSVCGDNRNSICSSKTTETFIPEILGLQKKSPLNSPYAYNEHSKMANNANDISLNESGGSRLKQGIDDFTNHANHDRKPDTDEVSQGEINTEASGITTTVVSEGLSLGNARGIVVVEEVALEQINELIASTTANLQDYNSSNNVVVEEHSNRQHCATGNSYLGTSCSSSQNVERQKSSQTEETFDEESSEMFMKRFEDLDTKEIAEALTNELKKYSIPQAVFARKVLNRSQGTLSDVLRKPKPWNELRGGREIFRKMKEWLDLPEVKRIPQLRTEAALELDAKARRGELHGPAAKKSRLYFTDSQKRALFAIFKETKKPSKEMQNALAEELGLERGTVANFFMNARRRHPDI